MKRNTGLLALGIFYLGMWLGNFTRLFNNLYELMLMLLFSIFLMNIWLVCFLILLIGDKKDDTK